MSEKEKNENVKDQESRLYELGYHLLPSIAEEEVPGEANTLRDLIEKHGGQVTSQELPKNTVLAYPLPKIIESKRKYFATAYFGWMRFEMLPRDAAMLKEDLGRLEKILRFIIIKTSHEKPLPPKRMSFLTRGKAGTRKERSPKDGKEKALTEEEIDKTIEELVAG